MGAKHQSEYVGYADKHIRLLIGSVQVGALDEGIFDSFYAELRRCRDHCRVTWEKDTKGHQHRGIVLDPETVRVLTEHWQRFVGRWEELGITPPDDAFLFSSRPTAPPTFVRTR